MLNHFVFTFPKSHNAGHFFFHQRRETGKIPRLVPPPQHEHNRFVETFQSLHHRIYIRSLGVVDEPNPFHLTRRFQPVFHTLKRSKGLGDHVILHSHQRRHQGRRAGVFEIVGTGNQQFGCLNQGPSQQFDHSLLYITTGFLVPPDRSGKTKEIHVALSQACINRRIFVRNIQNHRIARFLVFKYPALGFHICLHVGVAVQMVRRHVQNRRHMGAKLLNGLQLKARNFQNRRVLRGQFKHRFRESLSNIAAGDRLLAGGVDHDFQ